MWGPLQLKPLTDHHVSKVGTQPIQRLPCSMGWGSILLKPLYFSSQRPETARTSQGPLCTTVCLSRGRFLSHPQTRKGPMMPCVLTHALAGPRREAGFPSRHCSSSLQAQTGRNVLHPKTIHTFPLSPAKKERSAFVSLRLCWG